MCPVERNEVVKLIERRRRRRLRELRDEARERRCELFVRSGDALDVHFSSPDRRGLDGSMAYGFDVVAVRVEDITAVVVGVVPPDAGLAVVGPTCLERR